METARISRGVPSTLGTCFMGSASRIALSGYPVDLKSQVKRETEVLVRNRIPLIGTFIGLLLLPAALTLALSSPVRPAPTQAVSAPAAISTPVKAQLDLFIEADCSGAQCGLSGTGGEHFWVIASYAAIIKEAIIPRIEEACDTAGPELGALCDLLGEALDRLVDGVKALTNEGVWGSVYISPSYKGSRVQYGRYT